MSTPLNSLAPSLLARKSVEHNSRVAIGSASGGVRYEELEERSNSLARHLQTLGITRDSLAGVCLNRSAEFVISALAVWKAGGAYVPLDPDYPAERISRVLGDADVSVIVSDTANAAKLPAGDYKLILVDRDAQEIAANCAGPLPLQATEDQLAYVIYTSGSTGLPNGVEVTHGNLANLIEWHHRAFQITPADRGMFASSPGFDAAVWEVWPYLTAGASVHLPEEAIRRAPELLREWMIQERISIGFVSSPLAESLITMEWPSDAALRTLLTGADRLLRFPGRRLPFVLVNNYGPTECTVVATSGAVPMQNAGKGLPSIGKPVLNAEIFLLDHDGNPVVAGAEGEIFIGGAGVARGYHNRPELTEQRFITKAFADGSARRLYRTGDRGRLLHNGEFAFLGRVDGQVKIRGYRIEPGEVASALNRHPAVRACEIAAEQDYMGGGRLVAYVVLHGSQRPTPRGLQDFLRLHLPHYMLPAAFVLIDALPLTAHGKVDRAALPKPAPENLLRDPQPKPKSVIEERVAAILAKTLRVPEVGLEDNFFDLGGHSLLGTRLSIQFREQLGVDVDLRTVLANPTAAGLAAKIESLIIEKLPVGAGAARV